MLPHQVVGAHRPIIRFVLSVFIMNQQYQNPGDVQVTIEHRSKVERAITRALAVIGVIAIVVIVIWAGLMVVRSLPTAITAVQNAAVGLTQVFSPKKEEAISLSMSTLVARSGAPYTIAWGHTTTESTGTYALTYSCRDGLSVESPNTDGTYQSAFCDTPFNFARSNTEIRIVPTSTQNRYLDVPMTISYFPEGASTPTVQKTFVMTIENPSVSVSPSTTGGTVATSTAATSTPVTTPTTTTRPTTGTTRPTGTTTVTPGPRTDNTYQIPGTGGSTPGSTTAKPINPNGKPDLAVNVLDVGYIDAATNKFVAASSVNRSERVAVRFEIENKGNNVSDSWMFSAILPTYPPFVFQSQTQQKLNPGEKIEYTLGFDKVATGNSVDLKIFADQSLKINESNEENNIKIVTINIKD